VGQLGANAQGEVLEPGRVPDCYLGLLLDPPGQTEPAGLLVVAPAALLHPGVPQPDGTVLYELLTGHPGRTPRELVFLPDLTVELRAWRADTWAKGRDRPAGDRLGSGGRLAAWRLAGPAAGRADRRGGPGLGAAGHDLGARPARRPARPPARPGVPAVAAPVQRPPGRRPLPVAPTPAACGRVRGGQRPSGTRPRFRKQCWTADAGRVQVRSRPDTRSAATVQPSGRHRQVVAAVPDASRTPWPCPQAAAGAHCRRRRACMDSQRSAAAVSLPCSRGCGGVRGVAGSVAGCWPDGRGPPRTPPRCPVPWTPAEVAG
jgi:hypothetical protein